MRPRSDGSSPGIMKSLRIATKGEKEGHGEARESHGVVQTHRHRRLGQVPARWG